MGRKNEFRDRFNALIARAKELGLAEHVGELGDDAIDAADAALEDALRAWHTGDEVGALAKLEAVVEILAKARQ